MNHLDATGPSIWLRYAKQYSKDGQTHTIEMSIPVPLGASAEQREALIREAEAGMNQLVSRFGHPVSQTPQRIQESSAEYNAVSRSAPMQKVAPPQQPRNQSTASAAPSMAQIAARSADGSGREGRPMQVAARNQESAVPPTRPNIGASMPLALGPTLDSSGNISLPEFIQYIHENLNLTPRQAMEMLKVKSLSTGVNLREALERLRHLLAQKNPNPLEQYEEYMESEIEQEQPPEEHHEAIPVSPPATENLVQHFSHILDEDIPDNQTSVERENKPDYQTNGQGEAELDHQTNGEKESQSDHQQFQISEMPIVEPMRFDEEEDPQIEEELADHNRSSAITDKQLEYARNKLTEIREAQGASIASPKRLQALGNVVGDQITQEQLQQLIDGIWSISALKKLKVDQVEALISWAKQDDFVDEVEAILAVLKEDRYARGNW